mmetsp:Transcript_28408/g.53424  ORF Transcript_28408/g.53424 Transcript_28408/m.53424 type:complete len:84 (-) Transcript_28408:1899-2150(-)
MGRSAKYCIKIDGRITNKYALLCASGIHCDGARHQYVSRRYYVRKFSSWPQAIIFGYTRASGGMDYGQGIRITGKAQDFWVNY